MNMNMNMNMRAIIPVFSALMFGKETVGFTPLYHSRNTAHLSKLPYVANDLTPALSSCKAGFKTRKRWFSLSSSPTKNDETSLTQQRQDIAKVRFNLFRFFIVNLICYCIN